MEMLFVLCALLLPPEFLFSCKENITQQTAAEQWEYVLMFVALVDFDYYQIYATNQYPIFLRRVLFWNHALASLPSERKIVSVINDRPGFF